MGISDTSNLTKQGADKCYVCAALRTQPPVSAALRTPPPTPMGLLAPLGQETATTR